MYIIVVFFEKPVSKIVVSSVFQFQIGTLASLML